MKRVGYTPQNWDSIPDPEPEVSPLQPGDLVIPLHPMLAKPWEQDPKGSLYVCYNDYRQDSNDPNVCGFTQGTYMGPRRVTVPVKVKSGQHWSTARKIEKMSVLHHIFLFGAMQYSIALEDVSRVPDIYDDELENE